MVSDPNLIFLVLRDPPGGASSASILQGTSATFEISIDGMYTYHQEDSTDAEGQSGIAVAFTKFRHFEGTKNSVTHSSHAQRISHTEYAYTFNFQSTISTSVDPYVAGHASDVIIGGGVDLITNEAIAGKHAHIFENLDIFICEKKPPSLPSLSSD